MATVKGVSQTKYDAIVAGTSGVSSFIDGANDWGTKLRCVIDTYEAAAIAAGTVVELGEIPAGARVHSWTIYYDALGAAVTGAIKLGSTTIGAVTSMVAAGAQTGPSTAIATMTASTAAQTVSLTTADQAATGTITLVTYYTVED